MKNEDKIKFMHGQYGMIQGKCKDCSNFKRWSVGNHRYIRKCRVYGISRSEATDWKASFQACGMYNISPDGIGNMYKLNREKAPNPMGPLPGQVEFDFGRDK